MSVSAPVLDRDRAEIADRYKWNVADLYESDAAWDEARAAWLAQVPRIRAFEGRLGESAAVLLEAFDLLADLQRVLGRLGVYAGLVADEDTRAAAPQGRRQQVMQMAATLGAESAFIQPEVLRLPPGTIDAFLAAEPRLAPHRFDLEDIVRRAVHTLTPAEEKILADAGVMAGAASSIFTIFSNADFPFPTVRLADGRDVRLNQPAFALHRASRNRDDRQLVMSAFFGTLGGFERTLGTTMNASAQKAWFYAKSRKYASTLEASLDGPNVPVAVYMRLIEGVNRHLPTFHRYLGLRRRALGVDALHYYDLYAPLVDSVTLEYTPEEAEQHILAAMTPLGDEVRSMLRTAFESRWIDMYPTRGKRSGAYSNGGAYDVHPYILMNFNGRFDDMSTLAHELGHSMQSWFSNRTQPFPTAGYPIFTAEVASTFNESLLVEHMLTQVGEPAARASILNNYLESIKGTVFRQTQFAEFELAVHGMAERGEPITGEGLARLYKGITEKYYGHAQGVCVVDDYVAHEWSMVPHFYREFYVFQYATSFTASAALAAKVKAGEAAAVDRYLAFLSAGGSKYPVELLRDAGVDMTTDEPLDLTIASMNRVMDELELTLTRTRT